MKRGAVTEVPEEEPRRGIEDVAAQFLSCGGFLFVLFCCLFFF